MLALAALSAHSFVMMAARRGSMTGETTMALMRIECPQADAAVIAETADATLLSRPLRSLADIEAIESVPLAERLRIDNFCHRVALAIEARDPQTRPSTMCRMATLIARRSASRLAN